MKKYELSKGQKSFIEGMRQPFVVSQFLEKGVSTLAVSDGFCEMFGYKDRDHAYSDMNQNMFKDIHPEDTAKFTNAILRFGIDVDKLDVIYRSKQNGSSTGYRVYHVIGERVRTEEGVRLAHIWFTDEGKYDEESGINLNRGFSEALRRENVDKAVRYDFLTGLPNMSYFFELADAGRKKMLDQGGLPALLYIDLSGMKSYNHKYGFSEGDRLLKYFATLLSRVFCAENCCHINADRFAALADENGLEKKLDTLFQSWCEMNTNMHLPICVGIYPNRMEVVPVGMAYDRAKIACDELKGTLSSTFSYYNDELKNEIARRHYILENFDRALSENWIQVYYQPILRAITGKVSDEEALARWVDPVQGVLPPVAFIPYLEDAGLIYRLDLYMLERVLKDIKTKEAEGFYIVPHSINLSRSDFDACDMVEEVRRRVDEAGVSRDRISIEITESVIGSDFDFIKTQIERFRELGFPVWMDDFGSGYSSLDVLQSIKFNLLKFDMGFMRRLDENNDGRIILTELMKMASALGVDTICEGVETEAQVHFLQEIGCSRLQGFFFSKPTPFDAILEYHRTNTENGYENPEESAYYNSICGLNLYDIGVVARDEKNSLQNTYTTLPMCIIEIKGDSTRFVRTNQSYRDFFMRFFHLDPSALGPAFVKYDAAFMYNVVRTCCEQGMRSFYDEKMPDGSVVHSFARRISSNAVTGIMAVAVAVLSIREPNEKLMIEQVLSVVEDFGEHMPGGFFIYRANGNEELLYANKAVCEIFGCDGLDDFKALTGFTFRGMVHPEDYAKVSTSIREQVLQSLADLDSVEYRIIRKDGQVRWIDDYGHYIEYDDQNSLYYVFISDVTEKHEQEESDKAQRAAVIEALTKSFDSVWLITDLETEKFELVRIDREMEHLMPANIAVKIEKFSQAFMFYSKLVHEDDRQRFIEETSAKSIARNTENDRSYAVSFRRIFEDGIRSYRIEFARISLPGGRVGIVCGFKNVDDELRKEREIQRALRQRAAVIEALTRPYATLWIITDMEKQRFELYRVDEEMANLLPAQEATKIEKFTDALASFSRMVLEEDRAQFLDAVRPENIILNTENKKIYSVLFRRVMEEGIRYYRMEFAKLELDGGETVVVAGFKDVDDERRGAQ